MQLKNFGGTGTCISLGELRDRKMRELSRTRRVSERIGAKLAADERTPRSFSVRKEIRPEIARNFSAHGSSDGLKASTGGFTERSIGATERLGTRKRRKNSFLPFFRLRLRSPRVLEACLSPTPEQPALKNVCLYHLTFRNWKKNFQLLILEKVSGKEAKIRIFNFFLFPREKICHSRRHRTLSLLFK